MKKLVIEVSGGNVQSIYNNFDEFNIVLVDWDNLEKEGFSDFEIRKMLKKEISELKECDFESI